MRSHNENYRDFSNRRSFNGIPCRQDEILAPVVIDDDYRDYLKELGLIWDNVETWHFPGSKESVLVAFIQVKKDEFDQGMTYFNNQVSRFLKRNGKGSGGDMLSIDEMLEAAEDDNCKGFDPTGNTDIEDNAFAELVIEMLIEDLAKVDQQYGQIFRLLLDGYKKGEILKEVDIQKEKTQGYALIKKVQDVARRIYEKEYE